MTLRFVIRKRKTYQLKRTSFVSVFRERVETLRKKMSFYNWSPVVTAFSFYVGVSFAFGAFLGLTMLMVIIKYQRNKLKYDLNKLIGDKRSALLQDKC